MSGRPGWGKDMTAEQIQAVAAVATFLAAATAVWATFRAPKLAARFAEQLRADGQVAGERRQLQQYVFLTLMRYRSAIMNPECVAALNAIDVVFCDAAEVRNAWRDFCNIANTSEPAGAIIVERYVVILDKMAAAMGLSQTITVFDVRNSWYPKGLGDLDYAALLEAQDKIRKLAPEANLLP